ncbi:hypothetical protein O7632_05735 [Solwaraspora sp. WMMD406]|uniref:hypothetical protein n=1 Tax=Solwaraspora sp. WMMD406 TaxID=3016095 RepID=UPI002416A7B1|nr:hypothetical protein [Solwaraspora sp. WMMD406]MDG4763614.1 hypothetical protein [Solwaraspora sp. WMMD406]
MSSIQEVKAGLAQAAQHGNATTQQIRAATDALDRMIAGLRAAAAGSGHPLIGEAISRCEQSKQHLADAAGLVQGAGEATRNYSGMLG